MHVLTLTTSAARLTQSRKRNGSSFARSFWKPIRRYAFHTWARFFVFRGTTSRILKKPKSASRVVVASSTAVNSASNASSQCDLSELSNGLLPETLTLGELLGKGTFGDVFRATDSQTNETYAVKVVSKTRQGKDPASKKLVKERIEHEVSMWCELQGFPSAVRLLKFYEDSEHAYFVQELCEGGTVEDLMKVRGHISEVEAAQIMRTVLTLTVFCHEDDICYCDIKPANFILTSSVPPLNGKDDWIKVIDFGSCEHVPEKGLRGEKGTPLYTAPEVYHSRYDAQSDIWSVGIMLYYLLSGEIPFVGNPSKISPSALSFYMQHGELKFEGDIWAGVSDEAKDLIERMLERKVKKRIAADDALKHPWMHRLAPTEHPLVTKATTLSDICPMDASDAWIKRTDSVPSN